MKDFEPQKTTLPFKVLEGLHIEGCKMAGNWGANSNAIFEVLEDWEHQLQHENIDFEELGL